MEKLFQLSAVVLAGIAAYFLWAGSGDAAFIFVVLGAVSFFLGIRFQMRARNLAHETGARESESEPPA